MSGYILKLLDRNRANRSGPVITLKDRATINSYDSSAELKDGGGLNLGPRHFNKKDVAITGHTKGLGEALYYQFSMKGHNVKGYSRSNGYDIRHFHTIAEDAKDANIFINNAYDRYSQVDLLREVFINWQHKNKTIINISSLASTNLKPLLDQSLSPYAVCKIALDAQVKQCQMVKSKCRIINIRPGHFNELDLNELSEYIYFISMSKLNVLESVIQ